MKPKAYSYVRFSSPEQEKGDSLRRQIQGAQKWAADNSLKLDDTLTLQDKGLSAFNGHHRTKGALGQFLKLVEGGKITKGSVLIIEAMDRLSREQVLDALSQFLSIIRSGIKLVTLLDGKEYDAASMNTNPFDLMFSINEMASAHSESQRKSDRLTEAWKDKRNKIDKKKLTAKSPHWLKPTVKKVDGGKKIVTGFKVIPDRAAIVKLIFEMKLNGKGPKLIAKELNESGCWKPPPVRKNSQGGWWPSYVNRILRDRAVLGEFQPHRIVHENGKRRRVPIGDPIKSYYPQVVDDTLFYQVRMQLNANNYKGGRTGKVNNLFTHFIKCGYCKGPMHFIDKGVPPKGGKYLVCDRAKRKAGTCTATSGVRYESVEKLVLTFTRGLKAEDLFPDAEVQQSELAQLEGQLVAVNGRLEQIETWIANVSDSIANTTSKDVRATLEKNLEGYLVEKAAQEKDRVDLEKRIAERNAAGETAEQKLEDMEELFLALQHSGEHDRIALRLRLREALKAILKRVNIYPGKVQEIELVYKSGKRTFLERDKLERYRMNVRRKIKGLESNK